MGELASQLECRTYSGRRFDDGLRDFVMGLGLKVLLADRIGSLWTQIGVIGYASISAPASPGLDLLLFPAALF